MDPEDIESIDNDESMNDAGYIQVTRNSQMQDPNTDRILEDYRRGRDIDRTPMGKAWERELEWRRNV